MKLQRYSSLFLTIIFLVAFIVYFFLNVEKFRPLLSIPLYASIFIALMKFALIYSNSLFLKTILGKYKISISNKNSFYISTLSSIGNYMTPFRGGAGIRAVWLKKKYNFNYSDFISTLSGNYIIVILINSLIGLISLILIHLESHLYSPLLYTFMSIVFILFLILSLVGIPTKALNKNFRIGFVNQISSLLARIIRGWNEITKDRILLTKLGLFCLLNFLTALFAVITEFYFLDIAFNIQSILLYVSILNMSLLLSLTPGSLGIRESLFIIFASIIGITTDNIMQIALLDRSIAFFSLFFLYLLIKIKKPSLDKNAA